MNYVKKQSFMRSAVVFMLILVLCLSLAACSSSSSSSSGSHNSIAGFAGDSASAENDNSDKSSASDSDDTSSDKTESTSQSDDKLVYKAGIDFQTLDYSDTISQLQTYIKSYECILESQTERDSDYLDNTHLVSGKKETSSPEAGSLYCRFSVRVPSDKFFAFINDVSEVAHVIDKQIDVENISTVYADNDASIKALETQKSRLLAMLEETNDIDAMIQITGKLEEVEQQLNRDKTSKAAMDKDVAYSSVVLTVKEVAKYTETKKPTFWQELGENFSGAWSDFLSILKGLLFFCIRALPYLIVFGILAAVIAKVIITQVRKDRKKKDNKPVMNTMAGKKFAQSQTFGNNSPSARPVVPMQDAENKTNVPSDKNKM